MNRKRVVFRVLIPLIIGLLFGVVISEGSFYLQGLKVENHDSRVELIIPAGTAEKISLGQSQPSIPSEITFYAGDILVVKNLDSTSHQLGPVWVPPNSSGILELSQPQSYSLNCSFQVDNIMGIYVRPRATPWIRIQGILAVGIPTSILIGLYSLAVSKPKDDKNVG